MTIKDFRRIALSFEVRKKVRTWAPWTFAWAEGFFCTLAHAKKGYGNLMLKPEQQAMFVEELPEIFLPVAGGWGRNGATHVVLEKASEDVLEGAIRTAYKLRVEANAKTKKPKVAATKAKPKRSDEADLLEPLRRRGGPCHGILLKKDEEKIYRNSGASGPV